MSHHSRGQISNWRILIACLCAQSLRKYNEMRCGTESVCVCPCVVQYFGNTRNARANEYLVEQHTCFFHSSIDVLYSTSSVCSRLCRTNDHRLAKSLMTNERRTMVIIRWCWAAEGVPTCDVICGQARSGILEQCALFVFLHLFVCADWCCLNTFVCVWDAFQCWRAERKSCDGYHCLRMSETLLNARPDGNYFCVVYVRLTSQHQETHVGVKPNANSNERKNHREFEPTRNKPLKCLVRTCGIQFTFYKIYQIQNRRGST